MQTKGVTAKKRKAAIRRSQKKHTNELTRNRKKKLRSQSFSHKASTPNKKPIKTAESGVTTIELPEVFDLHENYAEVVQQMHKFRQLIMKGSRHGIHLSFNNIKKISVASALMLAAEIDVWRKKAGKLHSRDIQWSEEVRNFLSEMGFFQLLGLTPLKHNPPRHKHLSAVKFSSAQQADGELALKLRQSIEQTFGLNTSLKFKLSLFQSLMEAILNATQHAYKESGNLQADERWWFAASITDNKQLTVAIYDRGLTIPKTIKLKWWFLEQMRTDSRCIALAMRSSFNSSSKSKRTRTRTRTEKLHRGHGLVQLLELVRLGNSGKVHIFSRKGQCCFTVPEEKLICQYQDNRLPIQGTLIEWHIQLSAII